MFYSLVGDDLIRKKKHILSRETNNLHRHCDAKGIQNAPPQRSPKNSDDQKRSKGPAHFCSKIQIPTLQKKAPMTNDANAQMTRIQKSIIRERKSKSKDSKDETVSRGGQRTEKLTRLLSTLKQRPFHAPEQK